QAADTPLAAPWRCVLLRLRFDPTRRPAVGAVSAYIPWSSHYAHWRPLRSWFHLPPTAPGSPSLPSSPSARFVDAAPATLSGLPARSATTCCDRALSFPSA